MSFHPGPFRVNLMDLAHIEFADAGFDFAHVADDDPHQKLGWIYFLAISFAAAGVTARTFSVNVL